MFYITAQVSGVVAVGTGTGAMATLVSRVAAPVSIPLRGIGIAGGLVSAACAALKKAMMKKLEKHESIKRTAESSLNMVNDLVSKSLEDEQVSNKDLYHILREMENYRAHKAGIKHRTRADLIKLRDDRERKIHEEAEQAGLERGKKETIETLLSTAKSSGTKS